MNNILIKAVDNSGSIIEFKQGFVSFKNLVEIISVDGNFEVFECSDNRLTSLPSVLPHNLKQLVCQFNKLKSLPDNLPNKILGIMCHHNELTSLPTVLPSSLRVLFCECNKLTKLPNLRQCKKLEFVDCDLQTFEPYMLDLNISFEY